VSAREGLLERQYGLLSALVAEGPLPDGFPAKRALIVSRGLHLKRRREALYCWPGLASEISLFDEYARQHGRPPGASPIRDGYRFALWLAGKGHAAALRIVGLYSETEYGVAERGLLGRGVVTAAFHVRALAHTLSALRDLNKASLKKISGSMS
jgi:hypothetical protein